MNRRVQCGSANSGNYLVCRATSTSVDGTLPQNVNSGLHVDAYLHPLSLFAPKDYGDASSQRLCLSVSGVIVLSYFLTSIGCRRAIFGVRVIIITRS